MAENDKLKRTEQLLKMVTVGLQEYGHELENCEGPINCYLCEIQMEIDQYFEN